MSQCDWKYIKIRMLHCRIVQNTSFYEKQMGKIWLRYFTGMKDSNLAQEGISVFKTLFWEIWAATVYINICTFGPYSFMIHINEVKMRCITHLIVHISILSRVSFFCPLLCEGTYCVFFYEMDMAKCMQAEQCNMLIKLAQHIKGLSFYWAIFIEQFTMARGNTIKHLAAEALILLAENLKKRQCTKAVE